MAQQMPMQTPQDLFVHELSEVLSAERLIAEMLGEASGMVQDQKIRDGLEQHRRETEQHAKNVEQAISQLGAQPHPVQCHAVEGLHQDLREAAKSNPSPEVLQGLVVGGACKTEHFEIAAYNGLVKKAQAMGQNEVGELLQQNLQDEQKMLKQVAGVADQLTQQMAQQQ